VSPDNWILSLIPALLRLGFVNLHHTKSMIFPCRYVETI
jgi:hypothetical protein